MLENYMLVGGLCGLERSLSTMLVDHGARKLCFFCRSASSSAQAQNLIAALKGRNFLVEAHKCNVAEAVKKCHSVLGRIRGVFQCAMVLRDTLFTNMNHQQWIESTRSKVQGSWNLHDNLKYVDFFIVLSSFAAIFGNRGHVITQQQVLTKTLWHITVEHWGCMQSLLTLEL